MHVSLSRRSHRVGLSMQYLLWFCFGLLAVVPWQVIRGEDAPDQPGVDKKMVNSLPKPTKTASAQATEGNSSRPKLLTQSNPESLIFRSQGPPGGPLPPPQPDPLSTEGPEDQGFMGDDQLTGRSGQAYGAQFQASAITGPAIGRKHPITPIQMMPYVFIDNTLLFADLRGFTDYANGYGANVGGGIRQYLPRFDRILGVNAFLDYDNTSGALFRDMGFGIESLGANYDIRANAYFPMGTQSQQLSLSNINGTQQFVGHLLQVDQAKVVANALHGFDSEIGIPVQGRIGRRHDMRVFGGGYWFEGTETASFGGWKLRAQANVIPSVTANLQVSNDPQFKTNVVFGVTWTFGGFKQADGEPKTQYDRMTTPVLRQYNMVVGLQTQLVKGVTVINPATGNPYFFEHVASYATGPVFDGTVEHPFVLVTDAQAVDHPNDIIFVHANSTYSGIGVGLQNDVRVLGEASNVEHTVATSGGDLLLPHPTPGITARPIYTNAPGTGVILASNSEFSGFQIGNSLVAGSGPAGVGILGNGVSNVTVRQTDVSFSGGNGVSLIGTGGTINFLGDTINSPIAATPTNTAFFVSGTTGNINFSNDPLVPIGTKNPTPAVINNTTGGTALIVDSTAAGSNVNFSLSTVNDTAGLGVQITNDQGFIQLGTMNLTNELANPAGGSLNILNDSGPITGNGAVTIIGSVSDAINIQNLAATGQVNFLPNAAINISNRQARGINLLDNAGTVAILSPVIVTAAGSVPLAGIEAHGNSGNITFQNITMSNGGQGILIDPDAANVPNTGLFTVRGTTNITTPFLDAITVTNVDSFVSFNTVNITNRARIGIELLDTRGPVTFVGVTTITNVAPAVSTFPAIDIRGNGPNASISFQNATITGATGPVAGGPAGPFGGVAVNIGSPGLAGPTTPGANPGQVTFSQLNIGLLNAVGSSNGTALFANNVGDTTTATPTGGLFINSGSINATRGAAVDIQNSAIQVKLTSVTSTQSPTSGIILANNTPFNNTLASALGAYSFTVTGVGNGRGTGGTISNANGTGVSLTNTGGVSLSAMNINNNASGVTADNTIRLTMINDGLANNIGNGVTGTNVQEVDILNSTFTGNAAGGGNAIHLTANQTLPLISPTNGSYLWNINNNTNVNGLAGSIITPAGSGDAILIDNQQLLQDPVSGLTTPLVLNFNNNTLLLNSPGTAAMNDAWIGPQSGNMNLNLITLNGTNTGIFINDSDLNFLTNFNILGNTINALGNGNNGILVNNNGPTDLFIGTINNPVNGVNVLTPNTFTFTQVGGNAVNAAGNFAMQFTTGANSIIDVFSNVITMTGGGNGVGDQALTFAFLQSPTTVIISNNDITMTNQALVQGQGVSFLAANGTINVNGALNNVISINGLTQSGPNWVFANPGVTIIGSFPVNGVFVTP